jgi:hypothetical protein
LASSRRCCAVRPSRPAFQPSAPALQLFSLPLPSSRRIWAASILSRRRGSLPSSASIHHSQPSLRPAFLASSAVVAADLSGLHPPFTAVVAVFLHSRGPRIWAIVSSAVHTSAVVRLLHPASAAFHLLPVAPCRTAPCLSRRSPAVCCALPHLWRRPPAARRKGCGTRSVSSPSVSPVASADLDLRRPCFCVVGCHCGQSHQDSSR